MPILWFATHKKEWYEAWGDTVQMLRMFPSVPIKEKKSKATQEALE
jgi:hypothetical protein